MRLGINKASKEDWLTEHMFIAGIHGPTDEVTYFCRRISIDVLGKHQLPCLKARPLSERTIVYIRNIDGRARAVNVEKGLFGIIQDINPDDDPMIWKILNEENEIIFSNILKTEDGTVHWIGKPGDFA